MRYRLGLGALIGVLAFAAAGCGGSDDGGGGAEGNEDVTGSISVMAIWAGEEQKSFQAVIDGFNEQYPNVDVKYTSGGDNLAPLLSTAIEGGNPPDLAAIGQPGLMADFVKKGAIKSIDGLRDKIVDAFGEAVADAGSVDGTQYAVMFKGSNKSTIWYNVASFEEAGVEPPETWDELNEVRDTLLAAGITPYSVGVDVGWPMTDLFENIYIRSAGAEKYDQLSRHEIPWTDQSVKDALKIMADIVGKSNYMVGGTDGALQTEMPDSVAKVFTDKPDAAMVVLGDFAPGVTETTLEPETGYNVFTFPSIEDSGPAVVGGGDLFVKFKDTPAADAFLEYLTTVEAAEIWAKRGGFSSPNKNLDVSVYPDEITKEIAGALAEAAKANTFRFDMSDLQPAAFGGTPGQGLFKEFTDFVANPNDIDGVTQADGGLGSKGLRLDEPDERERIDGGGSHGGASAQGLQAQPLGAVRSRRRVPCARAHLPRRLDRLSDDSNDHPKLLRPERRQRSSGSTTTRSSSATTRSLTALRNNFLWILVVPALVTAIGLIFAVLLERVRFSTAFKVAVFMPMAISLFAAGVIWRLMYEKDPDQGTVNAAIAVVKDAVQPSGVLSAARPSTDKLQGGPEGGLVLEQPLEPGGVAQLGLTAIRESDVPEGAEQARRAGGACGRDHGGGLERFQARWRHAGQARAGRARPPGGDRGASRRKRQARVGDDDRARRHVRLRGGRGRVLSRGDRAEDLLGALRGGLVARCRPDPALDHDRVHLGLGRVRHGRDRGRPRSHPARPARGRAHGRRQRVAGVPAHHDAPARARS